MLLALSRDLSPAVGEARLVAQTHPLENKTELRSHPVSGGETPLHSSSSQ